VRSEGDERLLVIHAQVQPGEVPPDDLPPLMQPAGHRPPWRSTATCSTGKGGALNITPLKGHDASVLAAHPSHAPRRSNNAAAVESSRMIVQPPVTCTSNTTSSPRRSTIRVAKPRVPRCGMQLTGIVALF
jgi:hypothetical protein